MHCLLVIPEPKMWPIHNTGILYIGAMLEKEGHEVEIYDCSKEYFLGNDAIDQYRIFLHAKKNFEMIGFGFCTPQAPLVYLLVKETKQILPNSIIIFGGPHPTALPELTMDECPDVDIIVRNEGEITISEIINGKQLNEISGISYKNKNKIIHNPPRAFFNELDLLPIPARHLIDMEYYISPKKFDDVYAGGRRMATIITSRGCTGKCDFCGGWVMMGCKPRFHSIERIFEEIEILINNYNVELINFQDDSFFLDSNRAQKICSKMIKTSLNKKIKWFCHLTAAQVKSRFLNMLIEAGCYQVGIGFESFSPDTLLNMHKPSTKNRNIKTVKLIKKSGIQCLGYFMSGYLNETKESIEKTQDMQKYCALDLPSWTHYIPFPGTKDFDELYKTKKIGDLDWGSYDMAQHAITLFKRNYSAVSYPIYLSLYLSHIENYHFIRRYLHGIKIRTQKFCSDTGMKLPQFEWPMPTYDNNNDINIELKKGIDKIHEWDLFIAHKNLLDSLESCHSDLEHRLCLESLIYIHLQRMEDKMAFEYFKKLTPFLNQNEALFYLAIGNCSLGNYSNALRILYKTEKEKKIQLDKKNNMLIVYLSILMGFHKFIEKSENNINSDIDFELNIKLWKNLNGTYYHKGIPYIFDRYKSVQIKDIIDIKEFDRLIAPHEYRFLTYYFFLKKKLIKQNISKIVCIGFDRWTRMIIKYLKETNDFELIGIIDDRISEILHEYEKKSIFSFDKVLPIINNKIGVIITTDVNTENISTIIKNKMNGYQIFKLFPEVNDTFLLPSMTREIKGIPIHKFV